MGDKQVHRQNIHRQNRGMPYCAHPAPQHGPPIPPAGFAARPASPMAHNPMAHNPMAPAPVPYAQPYPVQQPFVVDRRPWWRRHPILTTLGTLWLIGTVADEPGALLGFLLIGLVVFGVVRYRRHADARACRNAELAARADAQHRAVLNGDPSGVYGFPSAEAPRPGGGVVPPQTHPH